MSQQYSGRRHVTVVQWTSTCHSSIVDDDMSQQYSGRRHVTVVQWTSTCHSSIVDIDMSQQCSGRRHVTVVQWTSTCLSSIVDVDMVIINKYPALLISKYEVDLSLIVSSISGYSISSRYRLECLVVANHHLNSEIRSKCFLVKEHRKNCLFFFCNANSLLQKQSLTLSKYYQIDLQFMYLLLGSY